MYRIRRFIGALKKNVDLSESRFHSFPLDRYFGILTRTTDRIPLAEDRWKRPCVYCKCAVFHLVRFGLLFYLSLLFFVDFADWLMHSESLAGVGLADVREGRQSPIITKLAFLRSQFTGLLTILAQTSLIAKSESVRQFRESCFTAVNAFPFREKFLWKSRIAYIGILYISGMILFRFCYYLYSALDITDSYWEITTYFVFSLGMGQVSAWVQFSMIASELSMLPLYSAFIHYCSVLSEYWLSHCLTMKQEMTFLASRNRFTRSFDDVLKNLVIKNERLSSLLDDMDKCFSNFLAVTLGGNVIVLASVIANGFVTSNLVNVVDVGLFTASVTSPIIALTVLVSQAGLVHKTTVESKKIWSDLVHVRQKHRGNVISSDECERLLTILHVTSHRSYSLTAARVVHVHLSTGITICMGFIGFMCFLIERSEQYSSNIHLQESLKTMRRNCTWIDTAGHL